VIRPGSNVLVIAHFAAKRRGSMEEQFAALGNALTERGATLTVALSKVPVPSVAALFRNSSVDWTVIDFNRPSMTARSTLALLRGLRPALVHLHFLRATSPIALLAAAMGVPIVLNHHLLLKPGKGVRGAVKRASYSVYYRLFEGLGRKMRRVAVSSHVAASVATTERVPLNLISVIPNGIDLSRFEKVAAEYRHSALQKLGLSGPAVACVARLAFEKGVDVAIAAFARVRATGLIRTLIVAGDDGPLRAECEALVQSFGIADCVHFFPLRDDIEVIYAACEQVWVPSRAEAFSLVAAEAMAAGRPVIASAVGGLHEVITTGRTGLLVPTDDPDSLAEAAVELLEQPDRARALVQAAHGSVRERYALRRFVNEVLAEYDRLTRDDLHAGEGLVDIVVDRVD
jgi:glycogen(starch) synthase